MANTPRLDNIESSGNLIINSNFDWWQEGTSFAAIAHNTKFADLFTYSKSGTMVHTVSRSTDVPNTKSSASVLIDCTTVDASIAAGDLALIDYRVEGYDFQPLSGEAISISFWVKATKTGIYCVAVRNEDASKRSYVMEYTINASNTWEKKTLTFTHDTTGAWNYTNGIGLLVSWALAGGSTYQTGANAWASGNFICTPNQVNACDDTNNDFRLAQVMVTRGSNPGEYRRAGKSMAQEFALIQRYFEMSQDANPGSAGPGYVTRDPNIVVAGAQAGNVNCMFKVQKRVAPSVTLYGVDGVSAAGAVNVNGTSRTAVAEGVSLNGFRRITNNSGVSWTAGQDIAWNFRADSRL